MSLFRNTAVVVAAVMSAAIVTTAVQAAPAMPRWQAVRNWDGEHWRGHWDRDDWGWRWGGFWRPAPFVFGYNYWAPYPAHANYCRGLAIGSERDGLAYWQVRRVLVNHGCSPAYA